MAEENAGVDDDVPPMARVLDHAHPLLAMAENPDESFAFWSALEEAGGTPLIEAAAGPASHCLVSFVAAVPEGAERVVLHCGWGNPSDHVMTRVDGAPIVHATYRVRRDAVFTYGFCDDLPPVNLDDVETPEWVGYRQHLELAPPRPDPMNERRFALNPGDGFPRELSLFEGPDAPAMLDGKQLSAAQRGVVSQRTHVSAILDNERDLWVYRPAGLADDATDLPLLVLFDGFDCVHNLAVPQTLDALIAAGEIEPVIAVLVGNAEGQREVELPCHPAFAAMVASELLPRLLSDLPVSGDAQRRTVGGVSFGALAATWVALEHPDSFGNVISQAGSFWWGPGFELELSRMEQTYDPWFLIDRLQEAPTGAFRIWQEIGVLEHPQLMLFSNRRMRDALQDKGYDAAYSEPAGAHDFALWARTLPAALRHFLGTTWRG